MVESDPLGCTVHPLDPARDLAEVLEIEDASFTNPWTREMFEGELKRGSVGRAWVARIPGAGVAGYCTAWLVAGELHINNFAVRPESRGRGIGRTLLAEVLRAGAAEGAVSATLEVRESNAAAKALYFGLGFTIRGRRRRYYTSPDEDALILWLESLSAADPEKQPGSRTGQRP